LTCRGSEPCVPGLHILDHFQGPRRSPRRRIAPHGERRPDTATEEVALTPAQTGRESEGRAALPPTRPAPVLLKTVRTYLLKEVFQQLWEYISPSWASKFLDEWCRQTMRSRIEPMKKIARSLRQHRDLILNYFRAQKLISSGVVEGLNNKAKPVRKSYGFRTYRARTRPLPRTWQVTRAGIDPRFLLTIQNYLGESPRYSGAFGTLPPAKVGAPARNHIAMSVSKIIQPQEEAGMNGQIGLPHKW
jgi:hypothetical protein